MAGAVGLGYIMLYAGVCGKLPSKDASEDVVRPTMYRSDPKGIRSHLISPIFARMARDAKEYEFLIHVPSFFRVFLTGAWPVDLKTAKEYAEAAGVEPIRKQISSADEKERSGRKGVVKCLRAGRWEYLRKLPAKGGVHTFAECWVTHREPCGWRSFVCPGKREREIWWKYHWQLRTHRWAWFTERQERELIRVIIDDKYSDRIVQETYDREMSTIEGDEGIVAITQKLFRAYLPEIKRAGMLYRKNRLVQDEDQ